MHGNRQGLARSLRVSAAKRLFAGGDNQRGSGGCFVDPAVSLTWRERA
jgi:hypothetical protein